MSVPAVYLPEALDDIDAAYSWYEEQLAGLGEQFVQVLRDLVDRIQSNPRLYGVLRKKVRAAPMRRFPYVVYYRPESDHILVTAVLHGRRSLRARRRGL